jgi:biotin transport system substrate-specific component
VTTEDPEILMQQGAVVTKPTQPLSLLGPAEPALIERLIPGLNLWQKSVAVVAGVALVALLAQVRFFIPDNPVPITLQGFGILMMGGVLGWRLGLASAALYYIVGLVGVPVFAKGGNGWEYVMEGVTGGYLIGFVLSAAVVGYLSQRGWNRGRSLWPMMIGSLLIYVPALIWLTFFDFSWPAEGRLLSSAVYPFIPGDTLKLIAAAIALGAMWRLVDRKR